MYCSLCGNQITDGNTVCSKCGNQINNSLPNYYPVNQRAAQREYEINEMVKMIKHFSIKIPQYNEYDYVSYEISRLRRKNKIRSLVFGCILCYLGVAVPILTLITGFEDIVKYKDDAYFIAVIVLGIIGIACICVGISLIYSFKKFRKFKNEQLSSYLARFDELSKVLYNHYLAYKNCPIGPQYTNPGNLNAIYQMIVSGRADTTKEAINVLNEDAHRNRMENLAAQTAQYAAETAQYAQNTAINTARSASYAKVGAFFSAANYFRK